MVKFQWNIYMINLNPVIGSEQAGTRPAVVISEESFNINLPVVTILPLTSYKQGRRIYPSEVYLTIQDSGLNKNSVVMSHQIRTISKKRLSYKCGEVKTEEKRDNICNAMKIYLDLKM